MVLANTLVISKIDKSPLGEEEQCFFNWNS